MHRRSFFPVAWLLLAGVIPGAILPGAIRAQAPVAAPAAIAAAAEPLRTAGDRPVDIRHIRLDLRVDLPARAVDAVAALKLKSLRELPTLRLDAAGFKVTEVTVARGEQKPAPARFHQEEKSLVIDLAPPLPQGQDATVVVRYRVQDPKEGLHFHGPAKADPDAPLTVWSQGEPVSNRHWFPCLDIPDQRQTTELVVTAAAGLEVLSNGKLVERRENPEDKTTTFHWLQDKPHPSYLVTLVVGPFDVVREEWDGTPVLYYVPKGEKDKVARTFGQTREMLDFFSRRFGVRYPWDKYAQVVAYEFGGGMENTSATTLGDTLQDERSILDGTSEGLIAHELAHQWWGDLVTCRDWAHLWLNEGFASYAECLWDEHARGRDAYLFDLYQKAGGAIEGGKTRPVVDRHYSDPGSMFDGRAYPKGAWVLHMLRQRLGDDAFWRAVRRYAEEHRLKGVETSDFRRALERETGRDLERFFYDWTERPGSPVLEVATEYLAEPKQARVVVKQTQAGEPFHLPLKVVFTVPGTDKPVVVEQELTGKEATLVVPLPGRPARVDVDPDYAILGEIKETKARELWEAQLREAPDVPGRLRALKHFAGGKTDEDRKVLAEAFRAQTYWGLRRELAQALADGGGETARDLLLEGLKDSDARVRRACLSALEKYKDDAKVTEAVRQVLAKGDAGYQVEAAALEMYAKQGHKDAVDVLRPWLARPSRRDVLRGAALRAMGRTGDLAALDPLLEWAGPGHPRTSRSMALQGLVQLTNKTKPSEDQAKKVREVLAEGLRSDSPFMRISTLGAVRDLGSAGADLLPVVEKLARDDGMDRVRRVARQTAEDLRAKRTEGSGEAVKLRDELEKLRKEQESLRQRLEKFEKAASKAG